MRRLVGEIIATETARYARHITRSRALRAERPVIAVASLTLTEEQALGD